MQCNLHLTHSTCVMQEEKLCEEMTWESMYGRDSVEECYKPYLGISSVEALINVVTNFKIVASQKV